jgi:phosphate transport system substrate-binding protein
MLGIGLGAALLPSARAGAGTITVKGSDTMVILGQRWAEEYMKANPGTQIQVTGGGSGTGISALINGTTDICQSSRAMKPAEKGDLEKRTKKPPVEIAVASDGLSIYVNAANPLEEISIEQLEGVFSGKVTNWKDLGGPDKKIVVYSRENSSGTYVYFKEEVLKGKDFTPRAQTLPGTAAVVNAITKDKLGIGYGGAAYAKGLKVLKVKKDKDSPAVAPSKASVHDGSYALARPLFFYLGEEPSGEVKAFVDWVRSATGQTIVETLGYFPARPERS